MSTNDTSNKPPLWKRRSVRITAVALAIPALALAWWLGSPLFLNKTVVEAFPAVAPAAAASATETAASDEPTTTTGATDVTTTTLPQGSTTTTNATADDDVAAEPIEPVAIVTGSFTGADASHQGSGSVAVYELEDGSNILRFENLDVTNGPDLHVILTTVADPQSRDDVMSNGYVDLGSLKGNRGDQNYTIPPEFDLSGDVSVVIYCEPFHVIFATATLQ